MIKHPIRDALHPRAEACSAAAERARAVQGSSPIRSRQVPDLPRRFRP
jgi:hypothetical protein